MLNTRLLRTLDRKQETKLTLFLVAETASPGTLVYANGMPYMLQNGLAMYHVPESYGVQQASPVVGNFFYKYIQLLITKCLKEIVPGG